MNRWWIYQRERFPLAAHGPLILAFSASAVAYSALLTGALAVPWRAWVAAFGVCLGFFLQLRVADEFKDAEDDRRWRPYRPVPRGLVALGELRVIFLAAAVLQAALAWWLHPGLLWVLLAGWTYLALMSVEFFAPAWLKARPITYLWTHMLIMPIVDLFATACHWVPLGEKPGGGLAWFLAASFANGLVIELGRKIRRPADEEEGVPTYSKLWQPRGALRVWWLCLAGVAVCGLAAAWWIDALPIALPALALGLAGAAVATRRFLRGAPGGTLETAAAGVTMSLYFGVGLIPYFLARFFS